MARKWGTALDLNKNELQNARVQNLAAAPGSPVEGQLYYDTVAHKLYWYNNSSWVDATGGGGVTFATVGSSAVGDAVAAGVATSAARSDHVHGREAFAAPTATLTVGLSAVTGTALTVPHSDHTHGTPPLTSTNPTASAVGDSVALGTGILAAKEDHKHAREAFGSPTAQTAFGASSGNGAATTLPRSDHTHGTPTHDAAAHSAIPLSALAAAAAAIAMGGFKITGLADGTANSDAASVGQVQALVDTGFNKTSVRAASTASVTLASALINGLVMDGVTLATGNRVLLKNQTTSAENGIYTVVASGAASRATDADISAEFKGGLSVWVNEGTVAGDTRWVLTTNDPITLGTTTPITFTQDFAASATTAGAGLTASGSVLAVGQGTGISVAADAVAVDTALVARWLVFTTTGGATSEVITHSLGNQYPIVQIGSGSTPWDVQEFDIEKTSTTTCTIRSSANIPAGLKVTVVG